MYFLIDTGINILMVSKFQVASNILKTTSEDSSVSSSSSEENSDSSKERLEQTIDSLSATLHFKDKEIHSLRMKLDEVNQNSNVLLL